MNLTTLTQRLTIKNTDAGTSLMKLIEQQIEGKTNDNGEPLRPVSCICKSGFCGACKIKVHNGEFEMNKDAIKELCMNDNETLACSTNVKSDEIDIEFNI